MNARHLPLLGLVAGSLLASLAVMLSWTAPDDEAPARVAAGSPAMPPAASLAAFSPTERPLNAPEPSSRGSSPQTLPASTLPTASSEISPSAPPTPTPGADSAAIAAAVATDPAFARAIEERLDDPDPDVRRAAALLYDEFLRAAVPGARADSVIDPSRPCNAPPLASAPE